MLPFRFLPLPPRYAALILAQIESRRQEIGSIISTYLTLVKVRQIRPLFTENPPGCSPLSALSILVSVNNLPFYSLSTGIKVISVHGLSILASRSFHFEVIY